MFKIVDLTVDYTKEPLGIENKAPKFGWKTETADKNWIQKSYRVAVATSKELLDTPDMWDSKELSSDCSDNIVYAGKELAPATKYWYKVTVQSEISEYISEISYFETALFDENFTAQWIAQKNFRYSWASYLRKEFNVPQDKKISHCRAYFSGLGTGELYINGNKLGDAIFDPAFTNYERIVPYVCYDVTENIKSGDNAVGVLLGDGWYNQRHAWYGMTHYGDCRMLLELHIHYEDGTVDKIISDESFKCDFSPIVTNNVHCGETYDARLEQDGWNCVGHDDSTWTNAMLMAAPGGTLTSLIMPPIRKVREVKPVKVTNRHKDSVDQVFIYDMGENFAGFVKIKIPDSPPGAIYAIRYAEETDFSGGLWYASSGSIHTTAMQQDIYITKGFGKDTYWEPRFTYHGFRYVEVTGVQTHGQPPEDLITGYAVNTDLTHVGHFHCSNDYINKIQELTHRTILSNYHGFPEDCPVRERCGWLGDAQLVSEAAIYNFDMRTSYEKYLEDIRSTKEVYGTLQMISPGKRTCGEATPLWGCAQIVMPWNMYLYYNDKTVLEKYYSLMCEWVDHELNRSKDYLIDVGLGDWCPPFASKTNEDPQGIRYKIPVVISSTAEFFKCADTMTKVADILGKQDDKERFATLAQNIKKAFIGTFYIADTKSFGTQGADGVALRYGLCPDGCDVNVANDYIKILNDLDQAMYTGIFANKHLVPALTEYGYGKEVLSALFSKGNNNFRRMIENGATSLYEGFVTPWECSDPASLNHPMQGAFTSYFYSHILGINSSVDAPGFKEIVIKPYIFDGVDNADGDYMSQHGKIEVDWNLAENKFEMNFITPPNTTGQFIMPAVNGFDPSSVTLTDSDGNALDCETLADGSAVCKFTNGSFRVTAAKK